MKLKRRKTAKLLLPRGYLSPTQMSLWQSNEEEYKERYFKGKKVGMPNMYLGAELAEMWEADEQSDDPLLESVRTMFPNYSKREKIVRIEAEDYDLLGIPDGFDPPPKSRIGDHKTALKLWTQRMADKSEQLTFYDLLFYRTFGVVADDLFIHCAESQRVDGELRLTGRIKTIRTYRTLGNILTFQGKANRIALEISKAFREHMGL